MQRACSLVASVPIQAGHKGQVASEKQGGKSTGVFTVIFALNSSHADLFCCAKTRLQQQI